MEKEAATTANETGLVRQKGGRRDCCLLFLGNGKLALRRTDVGSLDAFAWDRKPTELSGQPLQWVRVGSLENVELHFAAIDEETAPDGLEIHSLLEFYRLREAGEVVGELGNLVPLIREHAIKVPYLYFGENDYIYRFRTDKQRNRAVYQIDDTSLSLYHSALCSAIKSLKRVKERSADSPASLDFGPVRYLLPSHFGFCLGVQNAIERAYETIMANPGRRVFMLSELIHNPFVNEDLKARGLRYLQSDKGEPLANPETGQRYWDELTDQDIVVIPAFGARDQDKLKLIERGLPINQYDATCMLVEKVWKAAKRYGQKGYTVIIHGKAEHEETKATFSNSAKHAPSLILRDMKEAQRLAEVIRTDDRELKEILFQPLAGKATSGFDVGRDLERLAIVNQTTLLRNETLRIIELLEAALTEKYGRAHVEEHMAMSSKGDTLCYATQVNQDALSRSLEEPVDAAIVVGGKNSSNTFQLYRLCAERFGRKAFYIQSERDIISRDRINHFIFPYNPSDPRQGRMEPRPFLPKADRTLSILVTGGASCPDGILQQIIARINGFFPAESVRDVQDVLADLESAAS